MKALSIVLGILLVIGGFFLLMTPGITFASMSWVIGFLLLLAGINSVVSYFTSKKKEGSKGSVWELILGILGILLGGVVIINPMMGLLAEGLLVYAFDFWLIIGGILRIVGSVQMKKAGDSWVWVLIFAILSVVVGFYALFHIMVSAMAIGMLAGIAVVMSGFSLIASSSTVGTNGGGGAAAA